MILLLTAWNILQNIFAASEMSIPLAEKDTISNLDQNEVNTEWKSKIYWYWKSVITSECVTMFSRWGSICRERSIETKLIFQVNDPS